MCVYVRVAAGLRVYRCRRVFAESLRDNQLHYPPSVDELLAWAKLFRCERTYSNYLNYVRTGCLLVRASTEVRGDWSHVGC